MDELPLGNGELTMQIVISGAALVVGFLGLLLGYWIFIRPYFLRFREQLRHDKEEQEAHDKMLKDLMRIFAERKLSGVNYAAQSLHR